MTKRAHGAPVAWLYRQAMRQGDVIETMCLDNSWLRPCAEHEHDYIKGEPLVLESESRPQVLTREQRERRVYIAGPMTGIPEYNYPAFNAAAEILRKCGYLPVNPADHGIVDGAVWEDYFAYDLGQLGTCGRLYLLPGWTRSKGAIIEFQLATALKMEIMLHPDAEPVTFISKEL